MLASSWTPLGVQLKHLEYLSVVISFSQLYLRSRDWSLVHLEMQQPCSYVVWIPRNVIIEVPSS